MYILLEVSSRGITAECIIETGKDTYEFALAAGLPLSEVSSDGKALCNVRSEDIFLQLRLLCSVEHNRRNWLFFGTVNGAKCGAIIYSLIETERACGANARYYLRYVLEKMPGHMDDTDRSFLDDMMPWSDAYKAYEASEMYNSLHLNLESEEEPPRRTYRKESIYLVS